MIALLPDHGAYDPTVGTALLTQNRAQDFIFIPENPPPEGWENQMCEIISKVRLFHCPQGRCS